MICDHTPNCPHCKVAATLSPSDRIKWEALLRAMHMTRLEKTPPENFITARAESIRTARPFGRTA